MNHFATITMEGLLLVALLGGTGHAAPGDDGAPAADGRLAQAAGEDATMSATGEPVSARSGRADLGSFVVGLHVAPLLPVFSDLDVFVLPRLELGYHLPPWGRRLEVFFSVAYTAPGAEGGQADPRVPSAAYTWELTQKQLMLGLGLYLRFLELGSRFNPYVGVGPVVFFLETVAEGEAGGEAFGENSAQGTEIGLYGAVGIELVLGPGAGFFELGVTWSDLDNLIVGDTNTGALAPTLGYRFMF